MCQLPSDGKPIEFLRSVALAPLRYSLATGAKEGLDGYGRRHPLHVLSAAGSAQPAHRRVEALSLEATALGIELRALLAKRDHLKAKLGILRACTQEPAPLGVETCANPRPHSLVTEALRFPNHRN